MSELVLEAVSDGALVRADARLGAGVWVVLGADPLGLATLVAAASGARSPARGRVLLDGRELAGDPGLRRRTAALLSEEPLPKAPRLDQALGLALGARGDARSVKELLEPAGLASWASRSPTDLDASERRAMALLLALSHPKPALSVLYEPLAAGLARDRNDVIDALGRAASDGAVVLVATASLDDARELGGSLLALEGGVLTRPDAFGGSGASPELVVESADARTLAALLLDHELVTRVEVETTNGTGRVRIDGPDPEALATLVVRILAEGRARVTAIRLEMPPLEALLAARAGAARAQYDAAYQAELALRAAQAPAPVPSAYGSAPAAYGSAPLASASSYSPHSAAPVGASFTQGTPGGWSSPSAPRSLDTTASASGPAATGAGAPPNQSVSMPTAFADPTRPAEPPQRSAGGEARSRDPQAPDEGSDGESGEDPDQGEKNR